MFRRVGVEMSRKKIKMVFKVKSDGLLGLSVTRKVTSSTGGYDVDCRDKLARTEDLAGVLSIDKR